MGQGASVGASTLPRDEASILALAKRNDLPFTPPLSAINPLNPTVFLEVSMGDTVLGEITIELKADITPMTAENFRQLCLRTGRGGYKGTAIHKVVTGFVCQGGDNTASNGQGGDSAKGGYFDNENFTLECKGVGAVGMASNYANKNASQFFITLSEAPRMDRDYCVFGQVIDGFSVLKAIECCGSKTGATMVPLVITNCGDCAFVHVLNGGDSHLDTVQEWDGRQDASHKPLRADSFDIGPEMPVKSIAESRVGWA